MESFASRKLEEISLKFLERPVLFCSWLKLSSLVAIEVVSADEFLDQRKLFWSLKNAYNWGKASC